MCRADWRRHVPRPTHSKLPPKMSQAVVFLCVLLASGGMSLHTGLLEIVLYESVENGDYKTRSYRLNGEFSAAGSKVSAEGQLIQLHPLGLCNSLDNDELHNFGWVGVVKLERFEPIQCLSVFGKAKRAIKRGATAVIFDVSDMPSATDILESVVEPLHRPVIVIEGREADKLMKIVNTQEAAQIRLIYSPTDTQTDSGVEISRKDYFNMGIFVAAFIVFSLICVFVILKVRWRNRERQLSMTNLAKRAISKLETRKYVPNATKPKPVCTPDSDTSLHSSASESCAICLEGYREEQVLRVLPCNHDFHKSCVDPWLLSKGTCPLCKINITAQEELPLPDPAPASTQNNPALTPMFPLAPPVGPRSNYISLLYPPRDSPSGQVPPSHDYHSHQLHKTCPSCEGTRGSSSSESFLQGTSFLPGCNSHVEHYYQNINCIHSINGQRMFVQSYQSHGQHFVPRMSSYMMRPSCAENCGYHGSETRRHLYPPLLQSVRRMCEAEAEREAVRAASIVAVRGSSSSDPNPSDTSLECDCCKQSAGSTLLDSNKSTYGSSENKDSSDVSSYDSYFYRDRSGSSSGDENLHLPDETKLPSVNVRPSCGLGRNRRESDHREVAQNHVCVSQGKGDDVTQECDKCDLCSGSVQKKLEASQSVANPRRHGPGLCRPYKSSVISMPRSRTFSSPRDFDTGLRQGVSSNTDSRVCSRQHRVSAPTTYSAITSHCRHGGRHDRRRHSLCLDCRNHQGHVIRSKNSHTCSQWKGGVGSHGASRPTRVCSNRTERGYSRLVRPMPYRPVVCEVCRRLTHVPVPRRSMVLYSEPQGSFMTIPLGEKEKYEPENGV